MQEKSQPGLPGVSGQSDTPPESDAASISESQKLESRFVAWKAGELSDYEVEQLKASLSENHDRQTEKSLSEIGRIWGLLNHGFQYVMARLCVDDSRREQILKAVSSRPTGLSHSGFKPGLFSHVLKKVGPWIGGVVAAIVTFMLLVSPRMNDSARTASSPHAKKMEVVDASDKASANNWGAGSTEFDSYTLPSDGDDTIVTDEMSLGLESKISESHQYIVQNSARPDSSVEVFSSQLPVDNGLTVPEAADLPLLGRAFSLKSKAASQELNIPLSQTAQGGTEDSLNRTRGQERRAGMAGNRNGDDANSMSYFYSDSSLGEPLMQYKSEDAHQGFLVSDSRPEITKQMPYGGTAAEVRYRDFSQSSLVAEDSDSIHVDFDLNSDLNSGIDMNMSGPDSDMFGIDKISVRAEKLSVDRKMIALEARTESSPHPEMETTKSPLSTFAMNVSDVSFRLAWQSVLSGVTPDPGTIRSEEFINAMNYRDPVPPESSRIGITNERAQWPFQADREILRVGINTATVGQDRSSGMNLVILLDTSGSMERMDRSRSVDAILKVISHELTAADRLSLIGFAAVPTLWIDGMPGGDAQSLLNEYANVTPSGGTNLEAALNLAYEKLFQNYINDGENRILLLTDGAANLGEVRGGTLGQLVDNNRRRGAVLDCFGIGWDGYDDALLEALSRHGDGRYGFISSPDEATDYFLNTWLKSLEVMARDVKAQIEFNPSRVTRYRQVGYQSRRLTAEQFRDNTVDAGEMAGAESGQAVYIIQVDNQGVGPIGWARVRFFDPVQGDYVEEMRVIEYLGAAQPAEKVGPSIMLAASAASIAEYLGNSPYSQDVDLGVVEDWILRAIPAYDPDPGPTMIRDIVRFCRTQSPSPFK